MEEERESNSDMGQWKKKIIKGIHSHCSSFVNLHIFTITNIYIYILFFGVVKMCKFDIFFYCTPTNMSTLTILLSIGGTKL